MADRIVCDVCKKKRRMPDPESADTRYIPVGWSAFHHRKMGIVHFCSKACWDVKGFVACSPSEESP